MSSELVRYTKKGFYCEQADIYIDANGVVGKTIITHAHSDHARIGANLYLAHKYTIPILKYRLGSQINTSALEYGEKFEINGVKFSLHPAGHIIGSSQVRIEYKGEVWVISGDYKLENDLISGQFEPVKCNVFITESTFALPIYHWKAQVEIFKDINEWWAKNKAAQKTSVIIGYSLGKAQRIIANVDSSIGKIYAHGAIYNTTEIVRKMEIVNMPPIQKLNLGGITMKELQESLVVAPPSVMGSTWLNKLEPYSLAYASGWMSIKGIRRRELIEEGFSLSDHADWPGLNSAIKATGAQRILITHGYTAQLAKWLRESNLDASEIITPYTETKE